MSYIYVIGNTEGPIKIGITKNPTSRLYALRNATPVPINIVACFHVGKHYGLFESSMHLCLRHARKQGEWFGLTSEKAIEAIRKAALIADMDLIPFDFSEKPKKNKTGGSDSHPLKYRSFPRKELISIRLDASVLAHYRAKGKGWQTMLNDDLKRII